MVCVLEPSSTDLILILIRGRLSSPPDATKPGTSFGFSMSWFFRFRLRLCSFAGDPSSCGDQLRCFSFFRLLCLCEDYEEEMPPVSDVPAVAASTAGRTFTPSGACWGGPMVALVAPAIHWRSLSGGCRSADVSSDSDSFGAGLQLLLLLFPV